MRAYYSILLAFGLLSSALAAPILNGYYTKIARWRTSPGTVTPKMLDASLLTHVTFYSAEIDDAGNVVVADSGDGRIYDEFNYWVRSQNSNIKTVLSIGGWDLNTNVDTKSYFSSVASDADKRANFATSAAEYARKYSFDAISLDWFFPAFTTQGGTSADKANFVKLVTSLRAGIDAEATASGKTALTLFVTVAGNLDVADNGYDVASLAPLVDYFNVMTYNYYGDASTKTGVHTDFPSAKDTMDFYLVQGAPKEKLLMSAATFGRSFTVKDAASNVAETDVVVSGVGTALTGSNTAGLVAYYEIITLKQDSSTTTAVDGLSLGSILTYNTNQWVGYDDVDALTTKAKYALSEGYGGMTVWSIDLDDYSNGYPLTATLSTTLGVSTGSSTTTEPTDTNSALSAAVASVFSLIALVAAAIFL